jgi:hypothetical protein
MHIVVVGGSDAGISAALRAREVDAGAEVTVVAADAYPNFSICGIPYYVSGEVTHWRDLAHRTYADLEATGMRLRLDTTAHRVDVAGHKLTVTAPDGAEDVIGYDQLVLGTRGSGRSRRTGALASQSAYLPSGCKRTMARNPAAHPVCSSSAITCCVLVKAARSCSCSAAPLWRVPAGYSRKARCQPGAYDREPGDRGQGRRAAPGR